MYTEPIKNPAKIDLFVVLDISGSMNQTCNKMVNTGAGYVLSTVIGVGIGIGFTILTGGLGGILVGGILNTSGIALMKTANSRLKEAKNHLVIQIRALINENRINKLGLITFNQKASVACPLTDQFEEIIN